MNDKQLIADAKEAGMPPAYGCKTRHDIENDDCPCDKNGNCTQSELVGFQINRIENLAVITAFAAIRDKRSAEAIQVLMADSRNMREFMNKQDAEIARLREALQQCVLAMEESIIVNPRVNLHIAVKLAKQALAQGE
jgi:hypothetical protein